VRSQSVRSKPRELFEISADRFGVAVLIKPADYTLRQFLHKLWDAEPEDLIAVGADLGNEVVPDWSLLRLRCACIEAHPFGAGPGVLTRRRALYF
jgi:hypothetical protein